MSKSINSSIFKRLSISYALFTFVVLILIGGIVFITDLSHKRDLQLKAFSTNLRTIQKAIIPHVITSDYSSIEEIMSWAGTQQEFDSLTLKDATGAVLFIKPALLRNHWLHFWSPDHYIKTEILQVGGKQYGELEAEFNEHSFFQQTAVLIGYALLLAIAGSLLVGGISYFVMQRSLRPLFELQQLVDAIDAQPDRVGTGDGWQLPSERVKNTVKAKVENLLKQLLNYKYSLDHAGLVVELTEDFKVLSANKKYLEVHDTTIAQIQNSLYGVEGYSLAEIQAAIKSEGIWSAETPSLTKDKKV